MSKSPKTTTAPTGNIAPFGLRMLPELRAKIEEAAKASGRSMNAEIVSRLQGTFTETAVLPIPKEAVLAHLKQITKILERSMPDIEPVQLPASKGPEKSSNVKRVLK